MSEDFAVYERYTLFSPLPPAEIWARLEPEVEPLVEGRVTIPFAKTLPYEGRPTPEGFLIKRLFHRSQLTTPRLHARCTPEGSGTRLEVTVQRTGMSKGVLPAVGCGLALIALVAALLSEVVFLLAIGSMFCLACWGNWGLAKLTQSRQTRADRTFLCERLAATPAPA